jgi:large subunit ribosomal protein L24
MKTSIKKDDIVKVIRGDKEVKGKTGKVIEVLRDGEKWRVRIEGLRIIKRHIKPQKNPKHPEGGIIEGAGSFPVSSVMLMSATLNRPVRTGAVEKTDGKKVRVVRGRKLKADEI